MPYYLIKDQSLTGIADAIRSKNGTTDPYGPGAMANAIGQIMLAGSEFHIGYGDAAPADTTKLWVKTATPRKVYAKTEPAKSYRPVEKIGMIPYAAMDPCAVSVGTKAYLFGGVYGYSFDYYVDGIRVLDTETNIITTSSTRLPTGMSSIGGAAVGTKIYLFGGYYNTYLNTILVFDTESNTLSTLSTRLPEAAMSIAAVAVGTKIYLFGGRYGDDGEYGYWLNTIQVFDTETNTISTLSAVLPTTRGMYKAALVGTEIYLFYAFLDDPHTVHVFDTESQSLSTLDIQVERPDGLAVVGKKIFLIGYWNTIRVFDTETGAVTTLDVTLPVGGYGAGVTRVGTKIYRFGGYSGSPKNGVYMFDTVPAVSLAAGDLLLEIGQENAVPILPDVQIGVAQVYLGGEDGFGQEVAAAVYKNGAWEEIG